MSDTDASAGLESIAEEVLARLERDYDVSRDEGYDLALRIRPQHLSRPSVRLRPNDPEAATLAISFRAPYGLIVRAGHWFVSPISLPSHTAYGHDPEDMAREELQDLVDAVTSGRIDEAVELPLLGAARVRHALRHASGRSRGWWKVSRRRARQMIGAAGGRSHFAYAPWPRRGAQREVATASR